MVQTESACFCIVGKYDAIQYNVEMRNDKPDEPEVQREQLDRLRARVHAAKTAYLNRIPFEGKAELTYEDLRKVAEDFIQASYEVQKRKFGSVKVKISVAKLLRQR
jgi:hypothetical protein